MSNMNTPLHVAVQNGNVEIVKMLLNAGHDPNAVNAEGVTPFQIAAQMGNAEIVSCFIEKSKKSSNTSVSQPTLDTVIAPTITGETLNRYFLLWVLFLIASIILLFIAFGDIGYACTLLLIVSTIIFRLCYFTNAGN